jgi:hypothetical protein
MSFTSGFAITICVSGFVSATYKAKRLGELTSKKRPALEGRQDKTNGNSKYLTIETGLSK